MYKYIEKNLDSIVLVIVRDNLQYTHYYKIVSYNNLYIEEGDTYLINLNDKENIQDIVLCNESNQLEINNSYAEQYQITFEEFKYLFFKLPFLSELLRVSCSYMHQTKGLIDEEFDSMKLEIIIDENKKEEYYFSENSYNNDEQTINFRPKKSNTVKDLIIQIIRNKRSSTVEFLRNPSLYICEVVNLQTKVNERILYLDSFYSNLYLKNNSSGIIRIIFNKLEITIHGDDIIEKKEGYCKRYIDNQNYFEWRKAKINENDNIASLISVDYLAKPGINENDIIKNYEYQI
jgi:hypothetical protein